MWLMELLAGKDVCGLLKLAALLVIIINFIGQFLIWR
jgi:hypothetical protein